MVDESNNQESSNRGKQMKIGHRHYNNLIKELKWWWQERFSNHGTNLWISGFKPCTPEAKKHMEHIHKEKGKYEDEHGEYGASGGHSIHKAKGRPTYRRFLGIDQDGEGVWEETKVRLKK